jgi:hypothetical protein
MVTGFTKWRQSAGIVFATIRPEKPSVIVPRSLFLLIAATAALVAVQGSRAQAQWWSRAPADFEACADVAEKAASKDERIAALSECNAKFAGRRKPGGGYTYYDFMQDRNFDIAGPNPTPAEQKKIDEQYAAYLENQRRNNIAAAFAAKQQEQQIQEPRPQPVSLRVETLRVPLPLQRPSKLRAMDANCARNSFSCDWPRLSESINELKKLFGSSPSKGKKS